MFVSWFLFIAGVFGLGYWVYWAYASGSSILATTIVFFLIWTLPGIILLANEKKRISLMASPEKSEFVKILSRSYKINNNYPRTTYFVSFEFPDGIRKKISMDINQYNCITENEVGILT